MPVFLVFAFSLLGGNDGHEEKLFVPSRERQTFKIYFIQLDPKRTHLIKTPPTKSVPPQSGQCTAEFHLNSFSAL